MSIPGASDSHLVRRVEKSSVLLIEVIPWGEHIFIENEQSERAES